MDVVAEQRKRIEKLEEDIVNLRMDMVKVVETNSNLSLVLAHLSNTDFREYLFTQHQLDSSIRNWNKMITEYLENDGGI